MLGICSVENHQGNVADKYYCNVIKYWWCRGYASNFKTVSSKFDFIESKILKNSLIFFTFWARTSVFRQSSGVPLDFYWLPLFSKYNLYRNYVLHILKESIMKIIVLKKWKNITLIIYYDAETHVVTAKISIQTFL